MQASEGIIPGDPEHIIGFGGSSRKRTSSIPIDLNDVATTCPRSDLSGDVFSFTEQQWVVDWTVA